MIPKIKNSKKRGTILMENVVFIILNLLFIMILVIFISKQGQGAILLEESYAKQIALLIDSAKPEMTIILNMENAKELSGKNEVSFSEVVRVDKENNLVIVKLSSDGGYSYGFFNDVDVSVYPDTKGLQNSGDADSYVIKINSYNDN